MDDSKRGLVEQGIGGTSYRSASCFTLDFQDAGAFSPNVNMCQDLDYVLLKTSIPVKVVSGSEVLYGPVG